MIWGSNGGRASARWMTVFVFALFVAILPLVTAAPAHSARVVGAIAEYDFTDGTGTTVTNKGTAGSVLDLNINAGAVAWVPGGGISITSAADIQTAGAATVISDGVSASGEVTVEAWVKPSTTSPTGFFPKRIVSMEPDSSVANFVLGQADTGYETRIRNGFNNDGTPSLTGGTDTTSLQHVVLTFSGSTQTLYIDGTQVAQGTGFTGGTSNWNDSYPLVVGNNPTVERAFLGEICLVAVYDTALDAGEVTQNFNEGCVIAENASATLGITPGSTNLENGSTFADDSFQISNTGNVVIDSVEIDLSTAFFPDAIFDPVGLAGDNTAKCVVVNAGLTDAVGYQTPTDPCVDPFSNGTATTGYETATLSFDDFGSGEDFVFSVDVDPYSIKGFTSAGNAGAINGLELAGTTVTFNFANGTQVSQTMGDGSVAGSATEVPDLTESVALSIDGVALGATGFSNGAQAAYVPSTSQTATITGPNNTDVTLIVVDANLEDAPPGGYFDLDPFERNKAQSVTYLAGNTGGGGSVSFPITVTSTADWSTYLIASADSDAGPSVGIPGPVTAPVYLEYVLSGAPIVDPIGNVIVNEGSPVDVTINATDPDNDLPITLSIDTAPENAALEAAFTDLGNGDGTISWATAPGDASVTTVTITAADSDAGDPDGTAVFTVSVLEPGTTTGQSSFTITAGGGIGASTFSGNSMALTNNGPVDITGLTVDLGTGFLPDVIFDPSGLAGDITASCFTAGTGAATVGLVAPTDPCVDPYSGGNDSDGYTQLNLSFNDFGTGESFSFAADVDPHSIAGYGGAGNAGAISGLEVSGGTITVTYADGTAISQVFGDGSAGGSAADIPSPVADAITLEVAGVTLGSTVFSNNAEAAVVGSTSQTATISGPAGAEVTLIVSNVANEDAPAGGFNELDPFEYNKALTVAYFDTTIGGGGTVDIPFTVTNIAGQATYLIAAANPAAGSGPVTTPIYLEYSDAPITALYRVNAGGIEIPAADGSAPAWSADQAAVNAGGTAATGTPSPYTNFADSDHTYGQPGAIDISSPILPASSLDQALFQTERYDAPPATSTEEMKWTFSAPSGNSYQVNLFFAEIFPAAQTPGFRVFDVSIEGALVLDDYDVFSDVGANTAVVKSYQIDLADDFINIDFDRVVENPAIKAIEIIDLGPTSAVPGVLDVTPTSLTLDDTTPTDTLTLTNSAPLGSASLSIGSLTFTGADPGVFSTSAIAPLLISPQASVDIDVTYGGTAAGPFTADLEIGHNGSNTSPQIVALTGSGDTTPAPGTVLFRVNAGGSELAAKAGDPSTVAWEQDTTSQPSDHLLVDASPANSTQTGASNLADPDNNVPLYVPGSEVGDATTVFTTERYDTDNPSDMHYAFPVPNGQLVTVNVFLRNGYPGTSAAGQRVFDLTVEGQTTSGIDLSADYGHLVPHMLTYEVVSDGLVDVTFGKVTENPLVNAIEVLISGPQPNTLGVTPGAVDFGAVVFSGSGINQPITLTNLGGTGDPDITVNSVVKNGSAEFTLSGVPGTPFVLAPGASQEVTVGYDPTGIGFDSGDVTITHTASGSPTVVPLDGEGVSNIPVSFSASGLSGESLNNPTSLDLGPDGRLYVTQQNGTILAYTVVRNGANDYDVIGTETINLIKDIQNHDDDGTVNNTQQRQMTGILATGTAANPVLYVTSSDWRIAVDTDSGLDTNSGVISKLTWVTGVGWDHVQIVRGIPRSEENHSINGLDLDETTNTLYVMSGGHTNKGAPASNFSATPEYALSAALLSVDLDVVEALPVQSAVSSNGNTQQWQYDLPTLDDPTRGGNPDNNDPFGGNNGLNQARWVVGGPVQVYSPGYRNAFDVVLTEAGKLYTYDNGPNTGWGGLPIGEGPGGTCTGAFNEADSQGYGDQLHYISGPGYYGGHPNPTRATASSGLWVYQKLAAENWALDPSIVPNPLSWTADFAQPPVDPSLLNSVECDYLIPNSEDGALAIVGSSTNGITEYTANNFGGAMTGDLLAASFNGNIYRYELNAAGDDVTVSNAEFSGFGSQPLDVTAQASDEDFPGTVWAATYGANNITVFEPDDYDSPPPVCLGTDDILLDEDGDGFSNADEIDNGTDPCSGGSAPPDIDGDFLSDLNDDDDDNDGQTDDVDIFAVDAISPIPTVTVPLDCPVQGVSSVEGCLRFEPGAYPGSLLDLGFTGVMNNGTDYGGLFDRDNLIEGGAASVLSVQQVTAGDAFSNGAAVNDQEHGFQFGATVPNEPFTLHTVVSKPFPVTPINFQAVGMFLGDGTQDDYVKLVVSANGGTGGIQFAGEQDGAFASYAQPNDAAVTGTVFIDLWIDADPMTGDVTARYSTDGGATTIPVGHDPQPPRRGMADAGWHDGHWCHLHQQRGRSRSADGGLGPPRGRAPGTDECASCGWCAVASGDHRG